MNERLDPVGESRAPRGLEVGVEVGVVLGAAACFVVWAAYWAGYLIDDAFISLRYARNLAEGHGLVFNPGERVEGYTNFLWVILAAGAYRVGIDAMLVLRALSSLVALGVVVLVWRRDRAAAALLLGLPAVAFWSITGMESMAFAFLLLLAWTLLWRESEEEPAGWIRPSTGVFVCLALTRPEGVPLLVLCHGLVWLVEGPDSRTLRRHVLDGLGFAAGYGVYFAWRYAYYGEVFPNTYYAKVTGGAEQWKTGLRAFTDWAAAHPVFALALVTVPVLLCVAEPRGRLLKDGRTLALWTFCAAYSFYAVSVGGDFMPFFRFFLPLAAFFALLTASLLRILPRSSRMSGLVAIVGIQLVAGLWNDQPERAFVAHRTTVVGAEVGRTLADLYEPHDLLAVNTAGSLPYEARMPTVDMLGLGRFFGTPFHDPGTDLDTASRSPELGASFEVRRLFGVLPYTVAKATDVRVVWFERLDDPDDPDDLWQLYEASDRDVDRFLDLVVERWSRAPKRFDPEARARAESLAQQAAQAAQLGEISKAKSLLADASRIDGASSALVYQYVTNLAAMDGDVFLAVQAQREALRLDPENGLYRQNLAALLRRPFGDSS